MGSAKTPFEVLGITREIARLFSVKALRKMAAALYRIQAKMHHPDRGGDAERFKEVEQAWSILHANSEAFKRWLEAYRKPSRVEEARAEARKEEQQALEDLGAECQRFARAIGPGSSFGPKNLNGDVLVRIDGHRKSLRLNVSRGRLLPRRCGADEVTPVVLGHVRTPPTRFIEELLGDYGLAPTGTRIGGRETYLSTKFLLDHLKPGIGVSDESGEAHLLTAYILQGRQPAAVYLLEGRIEAWAPADGCGPPAGGGRTTAATEHLTGEAFIEKLITENRLCNVLARMAATQFHQVPPGLRDDFGQFFFECVLRTKLKTFVRGGNINDYLRGAAGKCRMKFMKKQAEEFEGLGKVLSLNEDGSPQPPGREESPVTLLLRKDELERLKWGIGRLSKAHRAAAEMFWIGLMRTEEIAKALGLMPNQAKNKIDEARKRLQWLFGMSE